LKDKQILDRVIGKISDEELIAWIKKERKIEALVQRAAKEAEPMLRKEVKAIFDELEEAKWVSDLDEGKRDFDVIAVGKSKSQQERIKSVRDIIRELERENGSAHIDNIIERAGKLGYEKDAVEAELARLVQEAAIWEPVRYSRNYRISQQ
jgi:DNA replicative helicase MCM subunit Mcm2 (Cdc46/Mcm family)